MFDRRDTWTPKKRGTVQKRRRPLSKSECVKRHVDNMLQGVKDGKLRWNLLPTAVRFAATRAIFKSEAEKKCQEYFDLYRANKAQKNRRAAQLAAFAASRDKWRAR